MKVLLVTEKEKRIITQLFEALSSDSLYPLDGYVVTKEEEKSARRFLKRNKKKEKGQ